jgi:hypothetical protein
MILQNNIFCKKMFCKTNKYNSKINNNLLNFFKLEFKTYEIINKFFLENILLTSSLIIGSIIFKSLFDDEECNKNLTVVTQEFEFFDKFFNTLSPKNITKNFTLFKSDDCNIYEFNQIKINLIKIKMYNTYKLNTNKNYMRNVLHKYLLTNNLIDINCMSYNGINVCFNQENLNKKIILNLIILNNENLYKYNSLIELIKNKFEILNYNDYQKIYKLNFNKNNKIIQIYYNSRLLTFNSENLDINNLFYIKNLNIIDNILKELN